MSTHPTRRTVLASLSATAISLPILQHLASADASPATAPTDISTGWTKTVKPADLKDGQLNAAFAKKNKFFLARTGKQVVALDTKCTHKGCTVGAQPAGLICGCHGARYENDGSVKKGPAKKPLARYALRLAPDGLIEVDTSQQLDATNPATTLTLT